MLYNNVLCLVLSFGPLSTWRMLGVVIFTNRICCQLSSRHYFPNTFCAPSVLTLPSVIRLQKNTRNNSNESVVKTRGMCQ